MKLYPPYKSTKIKIEKPDEFYDKLRKIIGHGNTILEGTFSRKGFLAEKRFFHSNFARPLIRGQFELKGSEHYLIINIEVKKVPIVFLGIFLVILILIGIIKQSIYVIPICIASIVFFYFLTWSLYLIDLKKTKIEMQEIIKIAST